MLGKELVIARILVGKTQKQVADEVGIPAPELCRIERGLYLPSPELEQRLKAACDWFEDISLFCQRAKLYSQYAKSA